MNEFCAVCPNRLKRLIGDCVLEYNSCMEKCRLPDKLRWKDEEEIRELAKACHPFLLMSADYWLHTWSNTGLEIVRWPRLKE